MNRKVIKGVAIVLSVISISSIVVGVVASAAPNVSSESQSDIDIPLAEAPLEGVDDLNIFENQRQQDNETTTRKIPSSKEPEEENTIEDSENDVSTQEDVAENILDSERTTISLVNIDTDNEKAGDIVLNFKNTGTNVKSEVTFSRNTGYISSEDLPEGTYKISVARAIGYSDFKIATKNIVIDENTNEIKITVAKSQVNNGFIKNFFKNNSVFLVLFFCVCGGYIFIKKKNEAKLTRD